MTPKIAVCAAATVLALGQTGDPDVLRALHEASARDGLALAAAIAGDVTVLPFDAQVRHSRVPYRFPTSAFGKAGRMVLWWFPEDFFDLRGMIVIDASDRTVIQRRSSIAGFVPLAVSEATNRIAFWTKGQADNSSRNKLYWSSFDQSVMNFVDESTGPADWSPDGQNIVYERAGEVYVFDVSANSRKRIASGHDPTWSSNGSWIALKGPDGRAWLVTIDGVRVAWPIENHQPTSAVHWSPDGRFVSFSEAVPTPSDTSDADVSRLVVCRVRDGKEARVLTFRSEASDTRAYNWIVNYRHFCKGCTPDTDRE